jgi:hypothetical protein
MQIDRNDEQRKMNLGLISLNFEFRSKATNVRDCPPEGRSRPRVTICSVARGMTTEVEPGTIDVEKIRAEIPYRIPSAQTTVRKEIAQKHLSLHEHNSNDVTLYAFSSSSSKFAVRESWEWSIRD